MTPARYAAALAYALAGSSACASAFPSLELIQETMLTTAGLDFHASRGVELASKFTGDRLASDDKRDGPHLACAEYGRRREAFSALQGYLGPDAVRPVSSTQTHGACFIFTASHHTAEAVSKDLDLSSFGAFPSALKLAPGLLEHSDCDLSGGGDCSTGRLSTTHGASMRLNSVHGLTVELSPGTSSFDIEQLISDLNSLSLDLHEISFWADLSMQGGEHLASAAGALRGREWSRAAAVVHELSESGRTSPSDICSWDGLEVHAVKDLLLVSGLDHLLYSGRGVGGAAEEEAAELQMACFMGLVSFLASRHEVFMVSTWNRKSTLNAAARANIQSATVTKTPLTDAGLDGSGEVVQVVDSGLNETSCFFADGDGGQVDHGHYFEEVGSTNPMFTGSSESFSKFVRVFEGGDFTYDSNRRKVIQYIELIKADEENASSFVSSDGMSFPFVYADGFSTDDRIGHGTHVAGTVAGSTLNTPAEVVTCGDGEVVGCGGGCISPEVPAEEAADDDYTDDYFNDDYYSSSLESDEGIDRLCPAFDCIGAAKHQQCLGDDVSETLSAHGGMAQGAKIAVMDIFNGRPSYGDLAGNGLWEACLDAGCKIHSNSYGADIKCNLGAMDLVYDDFMYSNPENLLVFAAGNKGWSTDDRFCTINTPAIAKNVLAIGSTSSGETRLTTTALDPDRELGSIYNSDRELADINTISTFSSYGPTRDGRIKPEVLAPGDEVYSAHGNDDGSDSCRLTSRDGTSAAAAVASGAAAMVRQYLRDSSFYAADVEARGFCGEEGFLCEGFSASSATVKAMLINSANLMGWGSEPMRYRGFGRIHLEAGMPLNGDGDMALFVDDMAEIGADDTRSVLLDLRPGTGLDLRATVSWIDPAATSVSAVQLVNNLDLRVIAPDGQKFYMWEDNPWDTVNVNERVIISAADIEGYGGGVWEIRVRSRNLATDKQSYSLVVTGPISPHTSEAVTAAIKDFGGMSDDEAAAPSTVIGSIPFLLAAVSALTAVFVWV